MRNTTWTCWVINIQREPGVGMGREVVDLVGGVEKGGEYDQNTLYEILKELKVY